MDGKVLGAMAQGAARGPWYWLVGAMALAAAVAHAGEITNAKTETSSAAQGLEREVRRIATRPGALWIGYRVPMSAQGGDRRCDQRPARAYLEPPPELLVLARVESGAFVRVRTFTPECEIDAGGMALVWLNDVKPDESVAWLTTLVNGAPDTRAGRDLVVTPAIAAIALHDSPAAVPALVGFARNTGAPNVRDLALRSLGRSKDPRAMTFFADVLTAK